MVFKTVGIGEVTCEEKGYRIEASSNKVLECKGEGMVSDVKGKPWVWCDQSQECFKKEGGLGHDEG